MTIRMKRNRNTALERSVIDYWGGGLNRLSEVSFYKRDITY